MATAIIEARPCACCSPTKPVPWRVTSVRKLFWGFHYELRCRNGHYRFEQRLR